MWTWAYRVVVLALLAWIAVGMTNSESYLRHILTSVQK